MIGIFNNEAIFLMFVIILIGDLLLPNNLWVFKCLYRCKKNVDLRLNDKGVAKKFFFIIFIMVILKLD